MKRAKKDGRMIPHWKQISLIGCIVLLGALMLGMVVMRTTGGEGNAQAPAAGPTIEAITVQTPGSIEKYVKFEVSFKITNTVASNPYFPYDAATPPGVERGTGITVDALLLPPGESDWNDARVLPCFYFQPVEEVGSGDDAALLPTGKPDWRCRFTPEIVGHWQYKLRATDASGTTVTEADRFTCVDSSRRGFIRISSSDPRYFEFSDGTPFFYPLINIEEGGPLNGLKNLRANIQKMGQNGIRFIRWFPTGEGANMSVVPFGDDIRSSWQFGDGWVTTIEADSQLGKKFSFEPYFYSSQHLPAVAGGRYRLTFRAKVVGDRVLRAEMGNLPGGRLDICSSTSTYHESRGNHCDSRLSGWQNYEIVASNTNNLDAINLNMAGLYVSEDAPPPFNEVRSGGAFIHSVKLQRDETGNNSWGPNLLTRSDPDTYNYIDQIGAARLDKILQLSEQYGVYHKLTLFHKNDLVLGRFLANGSVTEDWDVNNFYSDEGQAARWYEKAYVRYFIARWSYSPAIHSLELANENFFEDPAKNSAFAIARYILDNSPRHILMSNSFWGWWIGDFWADPTNGYLMDYSDKHWYANSNGSACDDQGQHCELISNIWDDSAAYVRECYTRFGEYRRDFNYQKPIVRGEGGVWLSSAYPENGDVAREPTGTYYHKKLWAHVGILGYSCDGEWYPRLFVSDGAFPNANSDLYRMYAAYERFMQGEPISNGHYEEIGTDLDGAQQIAVIGDAQDLRAWGARDASAGRVLIWIDNAHHTWRNVVDDAPIASAGGTLTVHGLPEGMYIADWWDTTTGTITRSGMYNVGANGDLTFTVSHLATDEAVRFSRFWSLRQLYLPLIKR